MTILRLCDIVRRSLTNKLTHTTKGQAMVNEGRTLALLRAHKLLSWSGKCSYGNTSLEESLR